MTTRDVVSSVLSCPPHTHTHTPLLLSSVYHGHTVHHRANMEGPVYGSVVALRTCLSIWSPCGHD